MVVQIISGGTNLLTVTDELQINLLLVVHITQSTVNLDFSGNSGFSPFSIDVSDFKR